MKRLLIKSISASFILIASISTQTVEAATISRQHVPSCRSHIASAEAKNGIPAGLLEAIATVESGVKPWVINYRNRAQFFHSKEAAAARIRELQRQGIRSINIGCMQLHAPSHQRQFKSIEDMLEPANNIPYAAGLLKKLHRQHGSMERAVKYYHSPSPVHNVRYLAKINRTWKRLKGKSSDLPEATPSKFAPTGAGALIKPATLLVESGKSKAHKHKVRAGYGVGKKGSR